MEAIAEDLKKNPEMPLLDTTEMFFKNPYLCFYHRSDVESYEEFASNEAFKNLITPDPDAAENLACHAANNPYNTLPDKVDAIPKKCKSKKRKRSGDSKLFKK